MTLALRDARESDLPAIVAIYNATVAGRMVTADLEPVSVESRVAWFRAHGPGHSPLWIAEDDHAVAGWLSFQPFYGRPAYRATAEISVYVATEHQRRGVGRFLIGEAIRRAPDAGLNTLLGFIFGHNAPSLALFDSSGFERWGHLPRIANLDGVERDLIIVGRRVDGRSQ
jgi:phosphinothricin acetyltransferase